MAVMADGSFPFGAVGLVHVENRIAQHRPIGIGEELTLRVQADAAAAAPEGPHLHAVTEARAGERARLGERPARCCAAASGSDETRASYGERTPRGAARRRRAGQRRVEARRRPRPPLRRRLRRPQPDPHALADREAARLPARRSRTGCGPRRAAWRRSRAACPTPSRSRSRFRKPILLPGRVEFAQPRRGRARSTSPSATPRSSTPHLEGRVQPVEAKPKARGSRSDRHREQGIAERSMGFGLRALNRLAGSDLLDRIAHPQAGRAGRSSSGTKNGFRTATAAGRTFKAAQKLGKPARQTQRQVDAASSTSPPTTSSRCSRRPCRAFAEEQGPPGGAGGRRRRARRRRSCSPRRTSSASTCSASPRSSAA